MDDCTCSGYSMAPDDGCECGYSELIKSLRNLTMGDLARMWFIEGDLVRISKRPNTHGDYGGLAYEEWCRFNGQLGWVMEIFDDEDLQPKAFAMIDFAEDALGSMPVPIDCLEPINIELS